MFCGRARPTSGYHLPLSVRTSQTVLQCRTAIHDSTLPTIGKTYEYIHGTWFATSGYRHTGGPEFELYRDGEFDPEDPESLMHIYIPVEK